MTQISVSDEDLPAVRAAYRPQPGAKVEFNVHDHGVSIVANREGWLSLAEWCMIMAHPEMPEHTAPFELTREVFQDEMFAEGRALLSFWGIADRPEDSYQDVYFHRGETIGDEYWEGAVRSGNSTFTMPASLEALDRYRWLEAKTRDEVEEKLGSPIFERVASFMQRHRLQDVTTACYKADTPEGWIGVEYDPDGFVSWVGYGMSPPWDNPLPDTRVVVPFQGL